MSPQQARPSLQNAIVVTAGASCFEWDSLPQNGWQGLQAKSCAR